MSAQTSLAGLEFIIRNQRDSLANVRRKIENLLTEERVIVARIGELEKRMRVLIDSHEASA